MPLIITLKCVAYNICILIFILHSTVAHNKESESKVFHVISYNNNNNNIFVELDKSFEFSCNSTNEVKACTVVTPYNAYLSINYEYNQTWYEEGRINISLEDHHDCIVSIVMANESDSGEWRCVLPVMGAEGYLINESRSYDVSVSYKNTYLFVYAPLSVIFCLSIVITILYLMCCLAA